MYLFEKPPKWVSQWLTESRNQLLRESSLFLLIDVNTKNAVMKITKQQKRRRKMPYKKSIIIVEICLTTEIGIRTSFLF